MTLPGGNLPTGRSAAGMILAAAGSRGMTVVELLLPEQPPPPVSPNQS